MSNYTKLNLRAEVEDQAPKFGMTEMEFHSARVPLELENAGLSFLRLAPNYRVPFGHHLAVDGFEIGDPLYAIETEKAATDIEAPCAGTLLEILAPEGANIEAGAPVCRVET